MNVRLRILQLLLTKGENLSVREIARNLDLPSSNVHYHLNILYDMGVLSREQVGDRVYSYPQKIFVDGIGETLEVLKKLSMKVDEVDAEILANCIVFFLKCHDSL